MKVLQLCNKPPYPPVDGGTMAMDSITQGLLQEGCEVRVLAVETDKHPARQGHLPDTYREATRFEAVYVNLRVNPLDAAVAMLCGESYHVKRYVSHAFADKLRDVLQQEQFDVVHVESIFLTPYVPLIRKHSNAQVILRAHNVEHLIWRRVARSTHHGLKRWYLKHLSLTLRAYELEHVNDYDGVACITRNDADYFKANGCRRPIIVIPFGITLPGNPDKSIVPQNGFLYHIGAMDWMPNREGVEWLLEKVWPVVHREVPQAHLFLAGRNIVPLLSGSGIRVKIIEAMASGKTVVTTTMGAAGIDYTDGENLLIADTPDDFARQIKRLLSDTTYSHRVGEAAARLVAERYDRRRLASRLMEFYNERLAK